jgi:hypothetical protein
MTSASSPTCALTSSPAKPWRLPAGGLTVFYGCPETPRLSHYFLPRAIMQGQNIACLDGANRFDPLLLARFARERGFEPSTFNERVRCARAFTCFQLTKLLRRVPRLLQSFPADVLMVTALPDLYFDEDVRDGDARASFHCVLRELRRFRALLPVAVFSGATPLVMPRRKFLPQLLGQADCVWRFSVKEDHQLAFVKEKPGQAQLLS